MQHIWLRICEVFKFIYNCDQYNVTDISMMPMSSYAFVNLLDYMVIQVCMHAYLNNHVRYVCFCGTSVHLYKDVVRIPNT